MADQERQAVIVGAGVIGCAIALQLARRGYRTINIDKNPDVGYGSTSNSCAIVRFSFSTLEGVTLASEGLHYWMDWPNFLGTTDERGFAQFKQCGHLMLKVDENDRNQLPEFYDELGIRYERWSTAEIRERLPILDTRSFHPPRSPDHPEFFAEPVREIAGGIFTPEAGYIGDPQLATHNLRRAVEVAGGRFLLGRRVIAFPQENGRVSGVSLADGEMIPATVIVNAAGPHSSAINRLAGVESEMAVKTRALRREVHHLPSPHGFDFEHQGIMTSDTDTGVYFRPEMGNKITLGSTDPACDEKTWVENADDFDREISDYQWKAQVYRLAKRIPDLPISQKASGVVDLYDVADDWVPIYDKSILPGFYMAIGTSGHQFKNAAAIGSLMADLIDECEQGRDHDRIPVQHRLRYTGRTLDLAAYSRLRALNRRSSFSVRG
jgi:sarcosine oxidase, subunit beta